MANDLKITSTGGISALGGLSGHRVEVCNIASGGFLSGGRDLVDVFTGGCCVGDITAVVAGTLLDGGATSGSATLNVDLSELSTSASNTDGDYFVVTDTSAAQRKLTKCNINNSGFNNDSGWTDCTGTVTSVGGGDGMSGTVTTAGTLAVDSTVVRTTGDQTIAGKKTFSRGITTSEGLSAAATTNGFVSAGRDLADIFATSSGNVDGSGSTGYLSYWSDSNTLADSLLSGGTAVTRTTGTLSAGCLIGPAVCGTTSVCSPQVCGSTKVQGVAVCGTTSVCGAAVCGTSTVCSPQVCGSTKVQGVAVCGTTSVCGAAVCGTSTVCSPQVCGSTKVQGVAVCGTTSVCGAAVCGTSTVCSPQVCGSTKVQGPAVCGTTSVCSPQVCGTTKVQGVAVCGTTSVCGPAVCGTTSVCGPAVCGTTSVCGPAVCGTTSVCSPQVCGTTKVQGVAVCGTTSVCGAAVCGTTSVCGGIVVGTSISATSTNSGIVSAGRDLADIFAVSSGSVDGSGTANFLPSWSDSNTLTNSLLSGGSAVTRTTGTLSAGCLIGPAVCGTTSVCGPAVCGTTSVCSPQVCGTTKVEGVAVCGTTSVCGPAVCGTTSVCGPQVCGTTKVQGVAVCGTTSVCGAAVCGTTSVCSPQVCGSTKVQGPAVCGTSTVCSPQVCGTTKVQGVAVCGTSSVCGAVVCGTTSVTSPQVCGTTSVGGPAVCGSTSVCSPQVCGTTKVQGVAVCGTTSVCGPAVCGTTSVCGGIVVGTSLSATSTNSGIVSAGRDLADVFTGGCCVGDITAVVAGTLLDGGATSGSATLNVDLSELATSTSDGDGDYFVVTDASDAQKKLTKGSINNSGFNNDAGYTDCLGDITAVVAGTLLDGGATSGSATLNVDLSELTDMTETFVGADEIVVLDGATAQKRKAACEIGNSVFNNDSGWTDCTGTVTSVGTGDGLAGGAITGSGTLTVDSTVIRTTGDQTLAGNKSFTGNTSMTGNLSVLGTVTCIDTRIETTSAVEIHNSGTGPALCVNQTGAQPVADFQDDSTTALYIANGGNVGIGTDNPNEELTVAGTLSASTSVCSPAICGAAVCGTTSVCGPQVCGTTKVQGVAVCGTTSVCSPQVCGTTKVQGPAVCGTTSVCGPAVCGTTSVCSPQVCGSTKVQGVAVCGTTSVCGPAVCGTTSVCGPAVCGTTSVCSPQVCGSTKVQGVAVCGTTSVCGPAVCGTTSVRSPAVCGSTSVCGAAVCGTTSVCGGIVAGTSLSATSTNSGIVSAGRDLVDVFTGGCCTGTTTASNSQTFTNKAGSNAQWTNDCGYTTCTGDITAVVAGTLLDGGATSGSATLNVDLSELSTSTTDGDGDYFVVTDASAAQRKLTKGNINNSGFNNDAGYTDCVGDVTGIDAGTLIDIDDGTTATPTVNVDLSELTDMTETFVGADEIVVLDSSAQRRKAASEIGNSVFNNDSGWTDCTGTTTASNSQTFTNKGGNISQWTNDCGYTTCTGTTTNSNSQTFTNKGGNISQWTNDCGYTTCTGTTTNSNSQTFTNKGGSNAQWTNDCGWTTCTGDITAVVAGTLLDGGATSGSATLNVDLSELSTSTTDGDGDYFVVTDASAAQKKLTKGNINNSGFNNDSGFTDCTGTVTSVAGGDGMSGTVTSSGSLAVDSTVVRTTGDQTIAGKKTFSRGITTSEGLSAAATTNGFVSAGRDLADIFAVSSGSVDGSGTANFLPLWSDSNTVTNSLLSGGSAVTRTTGTLSANCLTGPSVCGTTSVCSPAVCGTTSVCSPQVCGTTKVQGVAVCGTTSVCGPQVCGTTKVQGVAVCGTTSVCGPQVCGTTKVQGPAVCGSTSVCSPQVCGTTKVQGPAVCGTSSVCGAVVCGTTSVTSPQVCGTTSVGGPAVCGSTSVCSPQVCGTTKVQGVAVCGTTSVCGPQVCGTTKVQGPAVCGTTSVCGAAVCGTTSVCGGIVAGTSLSATSTNSGIVSAGRDLADIFTGGCCTGTTTASNSQTFTNKGGNISQWTNNSGYTTCTGDITAVVAGTLLDGGATSGSATLNVDLSELSTSTSDGDGDYFVVTDASAAQRKLTKGSINNSGFNNDSGWTDCTGTTTASNSQTFTNKGGNISQWTNDSGYTTCTGTTTTSNSQTFTNKGGNISQWTNDCGYTTCTGTGDITAVVAGTLLDGGATSGSATLNVDLSELTDMTETFVGADEIVVLDGATSQKRKAASEIGNSVFNNDSGWTDCTGTTTASNSQTFTNKGGNIGQWTNDCGYTTCTGTTTNSNSQTFTNKAGNISQWTNDSGYTTCTGDITAVVAGTALDGGATSGSATLNLDLSELATSTTDGDGDYFVVTDASAAQRKLTKGNINNSGFNNDAGYTTCTGTVTSVAGGDGMSGTVTSSGSLAVDSTVIRTTGNQTLAGNKSFTGNTSMTGNLSVLGTVTCIDTRIETTSAVEIHNSGTGPALCVNQTGAQPVADFQDDGTSAFYIENGGNVGINDTNPGHKLDVGGDINVTGSYKIDDADVINSGTCFIGAQVRPTTDIADGYISSASTWNAKTTCTGTTTPSNSQTFTNKGGNISQWTNDSGYTTCTGTTTTSNSQTFTNKGGNISQWTNDSGYTTCTGTGVGNIACITTSAGLDGSGSSGTVDISLDLSELTDGTGTIVTSSDEVIYLDGGTQKRKLFCEIFGCNAYSDTGFTTCTGTTTPSNSQTFTNKGGNISQWTNDSGYTTCTGTGDITAVVAGTLLDGGATSGSATLNVDLSELSTSTTDGDGDYFVVTDASAAQRKLTKGSINNSGFNNDSGWTDCTGTTTATNSQTFTGKGGNISQWTNDSGYTTCTGDITAVVAGTLLDGGATSGSATLNVDLSELTDMTETFVGGDEIVVLDGSSQKRKAACEIGNSVFNNDSGWTACTGTTTASNSQTFTNKGGNISQWTNNSGYTTCTGTTTTSNSQTFTNKGGNISQWTNDSGYTTCTGDITAVVAGTALDGGATSGSATLNLDLSELSTSTTDGDGDYFVVTDASDAQRKLTKGSINISGFNNDSGFGTGDITAVVAGTLLDGGATSGSATLNVDLSELTDMTETFVGADEIVVLDGATAQKRKAASEIGNSVFNNDSGWTACTGTTTASNSQTFTNKGGNISQWTNDCGYTTCTGTTTTSNSQTFTNKGGNISQWTNDSGYTTCTGTTTNSNSQTFTNKGGNISQWTNDSGYTACTGDITAVVAGTLLDGGATSGSATLNVDLSELATSTTDGDGDYFVVTDASAAQKKLTKGNINNSGFNNDSGWTDCVGTTTASNSQTFTNKGGNISQWTNNSGYTTCTGTTTNSNSQTFTNKGGSNAQWTNDCGWTACTGTTTASNSQTFTNKGGNISQWTNDSGYTACTGDITAVVAGTLLDGGATSGSATLNVDLSELTDMTETFVGADEIVVLDGATAQKRKAASEIGNSVFNNDSGWTDCVGTTTASNSQTFTNKGGNISQWTNDSGYTTCTGTTTNSNSQTFTNKAGNISQWTNDSGYGTGDITAVVAGTLLDGGATSGSATLNVDLSELTDMTETFVGADEIVVLDGATAQKRKAASEIGNSVFNNDSGWTDCTGTTTASNSQTFTNKGGNISQWTNNSGYTDCAGTVTSVAGGDGMSGTVTSSGSLTVDSTVIRTTGTQTIGGSKTFSSAICTDCVRATDGDGLKLLDDGGNGIFVEDGGYVGIGSTNPANLLDICSGNLNINNGGYCLKFGDATACSSMFFYGDMYWCNATGDVRIDQAAANKDIIFKTCDGSMKETMRIDGSTQQVGIGTATPNQLLTVKGSISASGAIQGQLDINAQSNYYYTLVIGDKGKLITFATTGYAGTLTIPPNSSVAFPIGTEITMTQLGTDQWTIAAGSGVTVYAADAELKTRVQYSAAVLTKIASDTWLVAGDLTA